MQSLRRAHVILIQPPDPPSAVTAIDATGGNTVTFGPSWDLMSLRTFMLNRTGHPCTFVDTRLYENVEQSLAEVIENISGPRIAVIQTVTAGLGESAAVIEVLHRSFPDVVIAISGQHPSQFPDHVLDIPYVDFGLVGDPEPILRNLLSNSDIPHRLKLVPGLLSKENPHPEPSWSQDLRSLSLPDWSGMFWPAYEAENQNGVRMSIRLSRGHSRHDADLAWGSAGEPLRIWPFDQAASCIQRCGHHGIVDLVLTDAPGFWTHDRITDWCRALQHQRSSQPWSFQVFPRSFDEDVIEALSLACCRRVEIVFPTADPDALKAAGHLSDFARLNESILRLQDAGMLVHFRFLVGGPGEDRHEADRIARIITAFDFMPYSLYPFPLHFDSKLYKTESEEREDVPTIEEWIAWARDPWLADKPVAAWGGVAGAEHTSDVMQSVQNRIMKNPRRRFRRVMNRLRSFKTIAAIEDKTIALLVHKRPNA